MQSIADTTVMSLEYGNGRFRHTRKNTYSRKNLIQAIARITTCAHMGGYSPCQSISIIESLGIAGKYLVMTSPSLD